MPPLQVLERLRVLEQSQVSRGHGIEAQQPQSQLAQMDTLHRPVVHPRGAQRAAVAASVIEDAPRIRQLVAVHPDRLGNILECVRMLFVEPIGDQADPLSRAVAAEAVCLGWSRHRSSLPGGTICALSAEVARLSEAWPEPLCGFIHPPVTLSDVAARF